MNIIQFSKNVTAAVVAAYKKGATLQELATKHKCSTSKIRKLLMAAKVNMRARGPKENPNKPKAKKAKAKKASKPKAKKAKAKKAKAKKASKPKVTNIAASTKA